MTNYNERLGEQLNYLMEYSYKYGRCEIPTSENPPLIIARQTKQAITSLAKELVAEAMPEPGTNLTSYEAQMFIISTEEYRQNLLKAL